MPFDSEPAAEPAAEVTARDRVMRLRDFLSDLPEERFNIRTYTTDLRTGHPSKREDQEHPRFLLKECGTAACVAGWACALFNPSDDFFVGGYRAGELLGLSDAHADALFTPDNFSTAPKQYTVRRAVAVLDHYLEFGEIDWSVAE